MIDHTGIKAADPAKRWCGRGPGGLRRVRARPRRALGPVLAASNMYW